MPLTILKHKNLRGIGGVVEDLGDYLPVGEIAYAYPEGDNHPDQLWVVGYGNTKNQDTEDFDIDLQFFYNPYFTGTIAQTIEDIAAPENHYLGLMQLIRYKINGIPEFYAGCPQIKTFTQNNIQGLDGVDNDWFLIHTWPFDTDQDNYDMGDDSLLSPCPWYAFWERRHGSDVTPENLCLFPQTYGGIVKMLPNAQHAPFTYRCATISETITLHPEFEQNDFGAILERLCQQINQEEVPLVECCLCSQHPLAPCRPDEQIPIHVSEEGYEVPEVPCRLCLPSEDGILPPLCCFMIPEPLRVQLEALSELSPQCEKSIKPSWGKFSSGMKSSSSWNEEKFMNDIMALSVDDNPEQKHVTNIILNGCIPYIQARTGLTPVDYEIVSHEVLRLIHEPVSADPGDLEADERTETYFILYYQDDDLFVVVIPDLDRLMQQCYIVESDPTSIARDQEWTTGDVEYGMEIYTYPLLFCPQSEGKKYFLIDEGIMTQVTKTSNFFTGEFDPVQINKELSSDQIKNQAHQLYAKALELVDAYINRLEEQE